MLIKELAASTKGSIVLDIEFSDVSNPRTGLKFETIQIGAVRIDEHQQIVGVFNSIIEPEFSQISTERFERLSENSKGTDTGYGLFVDEISRFCDWVGDPDTETIIWGQQDIHVLIDEIHEKCTTSHAEYLSQFFKKFVDLQNVYIKCKNLQNAPHLDIALQSFNVKFEGEQHFAVDDARNTVTILENIKKCRKRIEYQYLLYSAKIVPDQKHCYSETDDSISFASFIPKMLLSKFNLAAMSA